MDIKDRLALKVGEAAQATAISRASLYKAMQAGELPFAKVGASRLILRDDLEAFLARHRQPAAA